MDILKARHILALDTHTTYDDAVLQYRRLMQQHHPDKGGDSEHFILLQKAWKYWEAHHPTITYGIRNVSDIVVHIDVTLEEMLYGISSKTILFLRQMGGQLQLCDYTIELPPFKPGSRFAYASLGHEKTDGTYGHLVIVVDVILPIGWQYNQDGVLTFPISVHEQTLQHAQIVALPSPLDGIVTVPPHPTHQPFIVSFQDPSLPTHLEYALLIVPYFHDSFLQRFKNLCRKIFNK